ncbi:sensor histidine kinase [Pseudoalteromonas sp. T1lg48]|uniref:sensor histidine kinase n=1 Tax=Pseudoalteromonas sp. T1lg48 TaxID=2077100 RepID=UPI000CF61FB3|nr:ATP-binding protein [Pseudoalteromonas sp. T1lg48]
MASPRSLERSLVLLMLVPLFTIAILLLVAGYYFDLETLSIFTLLLVVLGPSLWAMQWLYHRVINAFDSVAVQLDSLANEEFTMWHFAQYDGGRIHGLKEDLRRIATRIGNKRNEYAQNEAFVFELINELHSPVVVLDGHQQVYHANKAANEHYGALSLLGMPVSELGLHYQQERWHLRHGQQEQRYTIETHVLHRGARSYQLLVFVSIEQSLRSTEKQAWKKLVRVLNHEVRNSLTPIYSLTQSLREQQQHGHALEAQMLDVIEKRAQHLLSFVASYSRLSQLPEPQIKEVSLAQLEKRLKVLFPQVEIQCHVEAGLLHLDMEQLEQALLNLVRNGEQANALQGNEGLRLEISNDARWQLCLYDNGTGIGNPDNLFVPFYSTKVNGSGIGLTLSREIIRAQGGELTLVNNPQGGAIAQIQLPQ